MRKTHKKQYLDIFELFSRIHMAVQNAVMQGDNAQALLTQCLGAAVETKAMMIETEGEDSEPVRLMGEYCGEIGNGALSAADSLLDRMRDMVAGAPERTEVVFMPYNASMWDSLDTVWRSAAADPSCDAYVVPVPYFDKNPDGSFRQEHYEGDRFPADIPVTDYRTFDLAGHHPDRIYIHNAYDQYNNITSVHPDYYSDKLKACTDELVYIPYYVLQDPDPHNLAVLESLRDMIVLPGVVNADHIIVQSENMRQVYIKVLSKNVEGSDEEYWEARISGSGSPKLDRVSRLSSEDVALPEAWQKIIAGSDGSRKKLFFYNTSVVALLEYGEAMLDKMERVFEIFKEKRDEVALLWRPHPLMESTLTAMRPQLFDRYIAIRDDYRIAGWGIYDDSSDLDRAVILSDAYYGDQSSVVCLFQKLHKPIMIQNVNI